MGLIYRLLGGWGGGRVLMPETSCVEKQGVSHSTVASEST